MTITDIEIPGEALVAPRAPGIYFNLDEEEYRRDPSLGSSNLKQLFHSAPSYWHGSHMNPRRKVKADTRGQVRGSAMHKLLYESAAVFDRLYVCGPRPDDSMTAAEKGALTKAANASAARVGKTVLPADDYDQVVIAHAMITKNPKLKDVFTSGFGEVSVFWRGAGDVPLKARIDYLKARGIGDGKGVANEYEKYFPSACIDAIARYRYDMQAVHYLEARRQLGRLYDDGAVHGDHDAELLKRIAASKTFGWQWVFYQTQGAPITWSRILSPQNPMVEFASQHVAKAIQNYTDNLKEFGTDMWLLIEEPSELYLADMPGWYGR